MGLHATASLMEEILANAIGFLGVFSLYKKPSFASVTTLTWQQACHPFNNSSLR
jgi:hypothetical protein